MTRQLSLFLFLLLAAIGITIETKTYTYGNLSGTQYGIIGLGTLIALCYIVPSFIIIWQLKGRWQVKPLALVFALIGGLLIAGWLAGYANSFTHDWMKAHLNHHNILYQMEDAFVAPLIEEPLKLMAVLFALYMVPTRSFKDILLLGIAAGIGFEISEDYSYIISDLPDGFSYTVSGILGRTIGAVASHWLYTALVASGLIILWRSRKNAQIRKYWLKGFFFFLSGFALHFAWNSPLRDLEGDFPWATGLLIALDLFIFIQLYHQLDHLDNSQVLTAN